MTNEIKNETDNNETVEPDQNSAAPVVASERTSGSEPTTDDCATTAPVETRHPIPNAHTALQACFALKRGRGRIPKVAQLPLELVAFVNEELLRNVPYKLITEALAEKGYPGFNGNNIGNWKMSGFKAWAEQQQTIDQQNRQRELALAHARDHGSSIVDSLCQVSAYNLFEAASALDPSRIVEKMASSPELFLKLNHEISGFMKIFEVLNRKHSRVKKIEEIPRPANPALREEATGGLTMAERDDVDREYGIPQQPALPTLYKQSPQEG